MTVIFRISTKRTDKSVLFSCAESVSLRIEAMMDLLSEEEVLKIARNTGGEEKVWLVNHELENKSQEALGYLGKHLTLTLNLLTERGKTQRRFFVKTYEGRTKGDDFLGETGIFKREQDFYGIMVEDLRKYVGKLDWCPEHQFSKERVLVLEDLSEKGFKMVGGEGGPWALDAAHLEAALETLAAMHATSLLFERRKSESLPAMYPTVLGKEILYDENKPETPTRKWITWQIQDLLEGVDYLDKYSQDEKIFIKENFEKQIMRIFNLSKKSEKYRNVLTHGDMWKNNLLFRYSDGNSPEECRFVDFQFVRYAPPAHDIMHLLHYALKKDARKQMESHFLHFYFENLKCRAKEHGVDIGEEMSGEEFVQSCGVYKELALNQCLLSTHYIMGPATLNVKTESYEGYEDFLTTHRKKYMSKFFQDESYVDKVKDTFYELIDTYLIKK